MLEMGHMYPNSSACGPLWRFAANGVPGSVGPREYGRTASMAGSQFDEVHALVRRIPRGRVATYGQIARLLGGRYSPRWVGWALHVSPEGVPWHRVVNAQGGVSTRQVLGYAPDLQKHLLEAEGVEFDARDRCDLERYLWDGD
jgi:methylated-DNA-protein-cysteine methyltransferase-like protein